MTRTLGFLCVSLLTCHAVRGIAGQVPASESTVTVTATIETIDKANRLVTLKRSDGSSVGIKAPNEMQGFDTLRVGDQVTATYFQAVVINLRRPGDPKPSGEPVTTTRRRDRVPGSETRRERSVIGKIQAIDRQKTSLTMTTPEGLVVPLVVTDARELQNLKVGDNVEVTYFESLLVKVARP